MPKVVYVCSDCGKSYDSEVKALACEEAHDSERKRKEKLKAEIRAERKTQKEKLKAEKEARLEAIRAQYEKLLSDIRKFNEDYAEPATMSYTGALDKVLDSFFKLF